MSDASELQALRAEIAALRDIVAPPPKDQRKRYRLVVTLPVTPVEQTAIRNAADARGLCVADLIRTALASVLPDAIPTNRVIPPQLRGHNRRKQTHHDDDRSDQRELDRVRREKASRLVHARLAEQAALAALDAPMPSRDRAGRLAEAAPPSFKRTGG